MRHDERTANTRTGPACTSSAPADLAQIGRYKLLGLLGRGGMGDVYLGIDEQLERQVAIKLLARHEGPADVSDRLQREALALARLAHPNVVAIHEVGEAGGQVYLVMERVDGVTLRTWLAEPTHSREQILGVMLQAGAGLAAAHAVGLIHRDFKPENVMVGVDGRVRVMDFGLACAVDDPQLTQSTSSRLILREGTTTAGFGTPGYMAPEQILGAPQDARSDIFSFCVVLFEALHGRRPFLDMGPLATREAVLRGQIVHVREKLPRWLDRTILRGLLGDPEQRWATMDALLAALARPPPPSLRRRTLQGLGLLAVATSLVLAAIPAVDALSQIAAHDRAERLAEEHLETTQALVRAAEARREPGLAAASFASFVADPAHRATRALTRAWRLQGDQLRAAGARDEALRAYGRAYLEAREPEETTALLRTMAEMLRAQWDGPALAQTLATLQARSQTGPADADLTLEAALLQGDLAGAAAAAGRSAVPDTRAWSRLFTTLAQARGSELRSLRINPLPGDGPAAFVMLNAGQHELQILDRQLAPLRRFPAAGRRLGLVTGANWLFTTADGQGELIDLDAPTVPLWRGPSPPSYLARAIDLDGDGTRELLFSRTWPALGFRALAGLGGPMAHERVAHPATDASDSELTALWDGDLDGDGTREIVAAFGPWNAFDLRVFHTDARGELELVARRSFGRITGLTGLRRGGEHLLAAINDEHSPDRELFPTPPHTGEPSGIHLLRWNGASLIEADFVPLPRSDTSREAPTGGLLLAADLDGDASEELIADLGHAGTRIMLLVRQGEHGLDARHVHGMRPQAVAQLDDDPASEVLVSADLDGKLWALGVGDATLPVPPNPSTQREVPPTLRDPLLRERWARTDELAGLGLVAPAAASLGEVAAFTADPDTRRDLLGQAATLLARAGDDPGVVALIGSAVGDPGPEALALEAAALARLGRHTEAHSVAGKLAEHPDRDPAQQAEAEALLARLAPLVAPGARIDLDFRAPLDPAWDLLQPGSLRRTSGGAALELEIPSAYDPVAELPLEWDGGPIALEYELDLERLEYGACVRLGLRNRDGELWLGAGVCGIGGAGQLRHVDTCKLAGVGWSDITEDLVPSAVLDRHLIVRVAVFPDGTTECSIDDGVSRHRMNHAGSVLPLPGPQRLAIGAFVEMADPTLAVARLKRVSILGARELPATEPPTPRAAAAHLLVEGEPAAALAALDEVVVSEPHDTLLTVLAYNDLRDPNGLARTAPELLQHLNDPRWQAELTLLLRTRSAAAMALYQAAKARLLPVLALAWSDTSAYTRDPEFQRRALAELGSIDPLQPVDPEERVALLKLLAMRGSLREQLGQLAQARRDYEAALAVAPTELRVGIVARVDTQIRLARLLAHSDPEAARAHARAAVAASPTPEFVEDRLAAIPGL